VHEGDHSILGDEHEHDHPHPHGPHAHPHGHEHAHAPDKRRRASRLIAGLIVAAAVVLFIIWRTM
jgi:hypothetical protein